MKTQTNSETVTEQYGVGTALGILAQYISDNKLALQVSKAGLDLAIKAQVSMQQGEPGDVICQPTAAEKFLAWLQSHNPHPVIPADWYRSHIYEISAKPLPPEVVKLSPATTLFYLNELHTRTQHPDTRAMLASVANLAANSFNDEVNICGTPWKKGPVVGPR